MKPQLRYKPGDYIGRKYVVTDVRAGGMGEVYFCIELATGHPYALKTFQQRYFNNNLVRIFNREILIWIKLEEHPNIVRCFFTDLKDSQIFAFLEWVKGDKQYGTSLRDWLRFGPIKLRQVMDFSIDICRGLVYANQKVPGLVHRDLKPENILITQDHIAKITDFGLAKVISQIASGWVATSISDNTSGAGTPLYMAPEQWEAQSLDQRTDIYALGCIIYEMLSARWVYPARTIAELKELHLSSDIPQLTDDLAFLNPITSKCLAKNPDERFNTVQQLLDDLIQLYQQLFNKPPRKELSQAQLSASDLTARGLTYIDIGEYRLAIIELNRAIQLNPTLTSAYNNRGLAHNQLGQYTQALSDLNKAIELDSENTSAYNNLAMLYISNRQYEKALDNLLKAVELSPYFADSYVNIGVVYIFQEKYALALEYLNWAIELDAKDATTYLNRGIVYNKLKKPDKALADYERSLQLDPCSGAAYLNAGLILREQGNFENALLYFSRAAELGFTDAIKYINEVQQEIHSSNATPSLDIGIYYHAQLDRLIGEDVMFPLDSEQEKATGFKALKTILISCRRSQELAEIAKELKEQYQQLDPSFAELKPPPFPVPLASQQILKYPVVTGSGLEFIPIEQLFHMSQLSNAPAEYLELCKMTLLIPDLTGIDHPTRLATINLDEFAGKLFTTIRCGHRKMHLSFSRGHGTCLQSGSVTPHGELIDLYYCTRFDSQTPLNIIQPAYQQDLVNAIIILWQVGSGSKNKLQRLLEKALRAYAGENPVPEDLRSEASTIVNMLAETPFDSSRDSLQEMHFHLSSVSEKIVKAFWD